MFQFQRQITSEKSIHSENVLKHIPITIYQHGIYHKKFTQTVRNRKSVAISEACLDVGLNIIGFIMFFLELGM